MRLFLLVGLLAALSGCQRVDMSKCVVHWMGPCATDEARRTGYPPAGNRSVAPLPPLPPATADSGYGSAPSYRAAPDTGYPTPAISTDNSSRSERRRPPPD